MAASAVLVVALAAGCGSSASSAAPGLTTASTAGSMDGTVAAAALRGLAPAPPPFQAFEQIKATIVTADGHTYTPCLLVARTAAARDQGLMSVTDPGLAGHAGMIFAFDGDVTGTFWMKDTVMALSVVFLDAQGRRISSADMVPCPTSVANCPLYPATAPYRWAIETPLGQLTSMGLGPEDHPKVSVGGSCST